MNSLKINPLKLPEINVGKRSFSLCSLLVQQKRNTLSLLIIVGMMLLLPYQGHAQRKVEHLGRGVVATNKGGGKVYISWRFFATDPEDIGFNVYRSINGGAAVMLNTTPVTGVTSYTDVSASTSQPNSYFVKPVVNGVELAASKAFTIPGSATAKSFSTINLDNSFLAALGLSATDYTVRHVYVGDLDGDGEYDYVVKRLPEDFSNNAMLEAYKSDGTFIWRIDLGHNIELGAPTHNPFVLVYDFDGDGKAEVLTRSGEGTKFADGFIIPDNGDGITDYRTLPPISLGYMLNSDGVPEYISMVDGMTGTEITRTNNIPRGPKANWDALWGDSYGHRMNMSYAAVAYLDGVHPSIVTSRGHENQSDLMALDYANGQFTIRWKWSPRNNPNAPAGHHWSDFHNIRVADVDGDGKDEIAYGVNTMDDNGTPLYWAKDDVGHGDRFVITDVDPDRPGLECYSIQQATNVLALYYDAKTGERIKTWSSATIIDVGRGDVADIVASDYGMEMWSYAHEGLLNSKGEVIGTNFPHPALSIWWDGDLLRENLDAANGAGTSPIIDKFGVGRILSLYNEGGQFSTITPDGGRVPLYGDILGDWREEIFCENRDRTEIRIFSSTIPTTNRIYCLMQNPEYRLCINMKGYLPSTETDFYLGTGMAKPPMPPILEAKCVWKGGVSSNAWDNNITSNWSTNDIASKYNQGDSVMFDISGAQNTSVQLTDILTPAFVTVNSPVNYTLDGAGSLSGSMGLLKSGKSILTLTAKCAYTGKTKVDEGTLLVNSKLSGSEVTVNWGATLGGTDTLALPVTFMNGAKIAPGTVTTVGKLTFGSGLVLTGKNVCLFDITDDSTGIIKPSDKIVVEGNLTCSGVNHFTFNKINDNVKPGLYPLITYSGTFTGTISAITLSGLFGQKYALKDSANTIWLTVNATRQAARIVWSGPGADWDFLTSPNWLYENSSDLFSQGDTVVFNGSGPKDVNLVGNLPIGKMTVDTETADYTFSGLGQIAGTGGITKNGSGALRLLNVNNTYTGQTIINGGTLEIGKLALAGESSSLGAATSAIILSNSKLTYKGSLNTLTDRVVSITGSDTIEVVTSNKNLALSGVVSGTGKLIKTGNGILSVLGLNTYTGGTMIKNGSVDLAGNFGTGTVTFLGGTINIKSTGWTNWNIEVPEGATGQINASDRCDFTGTLTGSGILGIKVPWIREQFSGNWSAFTGTINLTTDADGGECRLFNGQGYPNTLFNVGASVVLFYDRGQQANNGAQTVALGGLAGVTSAVLKDENWVIGAKNMNTKFDGVIIGRSINKTGTGILELSGANTYTGGTIVNKGTLMIVNATGSGTGTGSVTVNNSATLGGTGTISGAVTINTGGKLAPGNNSIGSLKINNSLTLAPGSITEIEINRTANTQDRIESTGTVKLNGTLKIIKTDTTLFAPGDNYALFSAAGITSRFSAIDPAIPGAGMVWDTTAIRSTRIIWVKGIQSISFSLPTEVKYGDVPFDLTATGGGSGNPVTFSIVSGDAIALSGNKVTILKAGSVVIKASQAGNSSYLPAIDVIQTLTILPAGQTISFLVPANKKYGDVPFDLTATGGGSGNPVTFSIVSGDAITLSEKTVTILKSGSVDIKASQAGNSGYLPAVDVIQTLTILPAEQTISFLVPANKKAGDTPFNLEATGGGSGNPVTYSIVSGDAITLSGNTVTIVKPGIAEIKASQAGDDRYLPATDVVQVLHIGQPPVARFIANPTSGYAPLLVSFDASSTSDADNDSLTYTWDFGDGVIASGIMVSHTYVGPGNYMAVLTVQDSRGDFAYDSMAISATSGLKAQYRARANEINPVDNHIKPHFQIVNTGDKPVPYKELTLRYWFSSEGSVSQVFWCDYALLGTNKVTGNIVPFAGSSAGADHYLEVSFTSDASIPSGGNSGEIQTRFNKINWSNYNEVGDYSYDPAKTSYQDWTHVTLYRNGILFWGIEPVSSNLAREESFSEANGFSVFVSPNPTQAEISLRIYSPKKDKFQIKLVDMNGKIVIDTSASVEDGESKTIPISIYSNGEGVYILNVINSTNKRIIKKIIKF